MAGTKSSIVVELEHKFSVFFNNLAKVFKESSNTGKHLKQILDKSTSCLKKQENEMSKFNRDIKASHEELNKFITTIDAFCSLFKSNNLFNSNSATSFDKNIEKRNINNITKQSTNNISLSDDGICHSTFDAVVSLNESLNKEFSQLKFIISSFSEHTTKATRKTQEALDNLSEAFLNIKTPETEAIDSFFAKIIISIDNFVKANEKISNIIGIVVVAVTSLFSFISIYEKISKSIKILIKVFNLFTNSIKIAFTFLKVSFSSLFSTGKIRKFSKALLKLSKIFKYLKFGVNTTFNVFTKLFKSGFGISKIFKFSKGLSILATIAKIIQSPIKMVTSIMKGLNIVMKANPFLAILSLIATAASLIIDNWDTLKQWFSSFFDWISNCSIFKWLSSVIDGVAGFFIGNKKLEINNTTTESVKQNHTPKDLTQTTKVEKHKATYNITINSYSAKSTDIAQEVVRSINKSMACA